MLDSVRLLSDTAEMPERVKGRRDRLSVSVGPVYLRKMAELMEAHGLDSKRRGDRTDYVRGMIYLDAKISGKSTRGLDRPAWLEAIEPKISTIGRIQIEQAQEMADALQKLVQEARDVRAQPVPKAKSKAHTA